MMTKLLRISKCFDTLSWPFQWALCRTLLPCFLFLQTCLFPRTERMHRFRHPILLGLQFQSVCYYADPSFYFFFWKLKLDNSIKGDKKNWPSSSFCCCDFLIYCGNSRTQFNFHFWKKWNQIKRARNQRTISMWFWMHFVAGNVKNASKRKSMYIFQLPCSWTVLLTSPRLFLVTHA